MRRPNKKDPPIYGNSHRLPAELVGHPSTLAGLSLCENHLSSLPDSFGAGLNGGKPWIHCESRHCLYVYVYIYIYIDNTCIYIYMYTYKYIHAHICVYISIAYLYIHIYIYLYSFLYLICIYLFTFRFIPSFGILKFVFMAIYIYILLSV